MLMSPEMLSTAIFTSTGGLRAATGAAFAPGAAVVPAGAGAAPGAAAAACAAGKGAAGDSAGGGATAGAEPAAGAWAVSPPQAPSAVRTTTKPRQDVAPGISIQRGIGSLSYSTLRHRGPRRARGSGGTPATKAPPSRHAISPRTPGQTPRLQTAATAGPHGGPVTLERIIHVAERASNARYRSPFYSRRSTAAVLQPMEDAHSWFRSIGCPASAQRRWRWRCYGPRPG